MTDLETMSHKQTECTIRDALNTTFARLDDWFDRDETLRQFKPTSGGWSIDQVLEHVTLTNYYLLLTLRKWVQVAEQREQRGNQVVDEESDLDCLEVIGERGSFDWVRPEHMEPTGVPTNQEVRSTLHKQHEECQQLLKQMANGMGALCRIKMSVQDFGKIDLYQWLYFLVQHARRHLHQLEEIKAEFESK